MSFDFGNRLEAESDKSSPNQDILIHKVKIQPRVKIVDTRKNKKVSVSINLQKSKIITNDSPL